MNIYDIIGRTLAELKRSPNRRKYLTGVKLVFAELVWTDYDITRETQGCTQPQSTFAFAQIRPKFTRDNILIDEAPSQVLRSCIKGRSGWIGRENDVEKRANERLRAILNTLTAAGTANATTCVLGTGEVAALAVHSASIDFGNQKNTPESPGTMAALYTRSLHSYTRLQEAALLSLGPLSLRKQIKTIAAAFPAV
uniref:Transcription initiation factor IIB n=1 Tax=Steinernema glaseri TaxID=37863 RepID=A0A1I7YD10_9BILA